MYMKIIKEDVFRVASYENEKDGIRKYALVRRGNDTRAINILKCGEIDPEIDIEFKKIKIPVKRQQTRNVYTSQTTIIIQSAGELLFLTPSEEYDHSTAGIFEYLVQRDIDLHRIDEIDIFEKGLPPRIRIFATCSHELAWDEYDDSSLNIDGI